MSTQLADALANELAAVGVQVVKRQQIQEVLSEQELAALGIVVPTQESAQSSHLAAPQYVILGRVNAYEAAGEEKAYIAIDLRVADTTTSVIVGSRTVEGTAKDITEIQTTGGSLGLLTDVIGSATDVTGGGAIVLGVIGSFSQSEVSVENKQTPVAKAIRVALVEASNDVDCVLVRQDQCIGVLDLG